MNNEIKEINIKIPGQILDYVDTKDHLLDLFNYITNLHQEKEDYKSRCEKAIEYVNKEFKDEPYSVFIYGKASINNLLNILQNGSDSQ